MGNHDSSLELTKEAQFELLVEQYLRKVFHLVFLFVKDRNAAEDITQDVFVKAYKNWRAFRGESTLQTWIYRIAVNESKKYLRSWTFRNILYRSNVSEEKTTNVEAGVMKKLAKLEFSDLVLSLPSKYREVIALHYYEDLSVEEVAKILGISQGAVHTRLHRARKQLKEVLLTEGFTWS